MVNWALYGVLCVQICSYLTSIPQTILLTVIHLQMFTSTISQTIDEL